MDLEPYNKNDIIVVDNRLFPRYLVCLVSCIQISLNLSHYP